jgi:hypothetical protein
MRAAHRGRDGRRCVLRAACCVLRAACCVLRAACCVLRAACCVLNSARRVVRFRREGNARFLGQTFRWKRGCGRIS